MNLRKRLILANAATVVIPVIITVVAALAFIFMYGKLVDKNLSLESLQRLSEVKFEILNTEHSILKQKPETVEEEYYQSYLRERLAPFGGEIIVIKNEQVLFASRDFSKIDIAKFLAAARGSKGNEPVKIGKTVFSVKGVDLAFNGGLRGSVLLLAPVEYSTFSINGLLIFAGIVFTLSFMVVNVYVTYQFSRSILKPLNNLQRTAAEISTGNLDCQIGEEGEVEIRELCRDLERMRLKLKESIYTQLKYEDNRKLLVSSISHDLKTPVTSIKGYVEGILDGIAHTPEKRDRYLKTIYVKAQQVDKMIDDLLLYAKLDLHQIPFNFEKTDIADYIRECVMESEPEFENSNIKITLHNELPEARYVLLDRERMHRVIMNILDNSRKYLNKDPGEIKVLVRETISSLIVEIRDNGSGISEKDLPYIFERFFRSDMARSGIKGSGLGLAIAKQIIEGHNGRVWAVSHGNEGTSIMISMGKV